jgi:hypothetical protein
VLVTIAFGLVGLGLLALGHWGARRQVQLSDVSGFDRKSREHRQGVLRRGAWACYAAGGLFVLLAVASVFVRTDRVDCGHPPAAGCTAACAKLHSCPPAPAPSG